jgi:hypothetical protein
LHNKCFSYSFYGTKETKSPTDVLAKHKAQIPARKDLKTDLNLKQSQDEEKELEGDKPGWKTKAAKRKI